MEAGKGSEQKIQWHQGFVGAMHCELLEDIDKLNMRMNAKKRI